MVIYKNDFVTLKSLVWVEKFKRCVSSADIKAHLDEEKVSDLKDVAALGDVYTLTQNSRYSHKSYPVKSNWSGHSGNQNPVVKVFMMIRDHLRKVASEQSGNGKSAPRGSKLRKGSAHCNCKNPGHLMSDCWLLKKVIGFLVVLISISHASQSDSDVKYNLWQGHK